MTELVTVELERGEWWLVRNQLRNMADEWRRFNKQSPLAQRCENIADEIDRQWYRDGTDTDVQDVTGQSGT